MPEVHRPLILDLVEWIEKAPRPYEEVMQVWRTSCPRLPVWEDAVDEGYVVRGRAADGRPIVSITEAGRSAARQWAVAMA
jgi:D-3-phosphoglycerate dehydrogenase